MFFLLSLILMDQAQSDDLSDLRAEYRQELDGELAELQEMETSLVAQCTAAKDRYRAAEEMSSQIRRLSFQVTAIGQELGQVEDESSDYYQRLVIKRNELAAREAELRTTRDEQMQESESTASSVGVSLISTREQIVTVEAEIERLKRAAAQTRGSTYQTPRSAATARVTVPTFMEDDNKLPSGFYVCFPEEADESPTNIWELEDNE